MPVAIRKNHQWKAKHYSVIMDCGGTKSATGMPSLAAGCCG